MNLGNFQKLFLQSIHGTVHDYTCDKQVLWESAGAFFPRDNSPRRKLHISRVRGLDFFKDSKGFPFNFFEILQ